MSMQTKRYIDGPDPVDKRRKLDDSPPSIEDIGSDNDVNMVIANLALPDPKIQVAMEHANHTSNTEVQAYAKLAGPTWTYYVQTLNVVIGRTSSPGEETDVLIDLSPSKVVSRRHASIQYNLEGRFWEMSILGRNGVRVDRIAHKDGSVRLFSGNVLDVGGVQMMFVLPDVKPQVAPSMRNAILTNRARAVSPGGRKKAGHAKSASTSTTTTNNEDESSQLTSLATVAAVASSNTNPPPPSNMPYPKGVAIITRPQVRGVSQGSQYIFDQDLSSDDAQDIKPPYSYATMITQAIMSTEEMMMSLSDIYDWISSKYSFYRYSRSGWQNSIRHNLSLNKAFEKVPRKANEPGKGMKWQITPQFKEEFIKKASCGRLIKGRTSTLQQRLRDSPMKQQQKQYEHVLRPAKKSSPTKSPDPISQVILQPPPAPPILPTKAADNDTDDDDTTAMVTIPSYNTTATSHQSLGSATTNVPRLGYATPKKSQTQLSYDQRYSDTYGLAGSPSPPNSRYLGVSQLEAYTPDRGSSRTNSISGLNGAEGQASPTRSRANIDGKQETKPAQTPKVGENGSRNNSVNGGKPPMSSIKATPGPPTGRLQLAPPSATQQLPSSFMPVSSPAPFWKFMQLSSTPVRGGDISPTKYSSPPARDERPGSDDVLGDLHDVDLTRGFRQIGNWRGDSASTGERTPEQLKG